MAIGTRYAVVPVIQISGVVFRERDSSVLPAEYPVALIAVIGMQDDRFFSKEGGKGEEEFLPSKTMEL